MKDSRVVWREGLFIRPQHFQQSDKNFDYEIMSRTVQMHSNNLGFYNLEIDEHLLNSGKFVLNKASGVMQDGTMFNLSEDGTLVLDIKTKDIGKTVYLSLPIYTNGSDEIYFEDQKNIQTRFKAKTYKDIPNINSGESSSCDLIFAKYNFKLSLEEDNSAFVSLPICRVADVSIGGVISLDKDFSSIFLYIKSSKIVFSMLKELMNTISFRAEKIMEKLSDTIMKTTEIGDYLLLQLLNKTEAKINFLMTQDRVHPDRVFYELSAFASELVVFMRKSKRLTNLVVYEHTNQYKSFKDIFDEIKSMLTTVIEQNSISLPINKVKYGIHIIPLENKELLENSTFIFSVTSDISSTKVRELLETSLKFGTVETIRNLVNYHLVGYKLKSLANAPKEIPYKVNHLYFKLELTNENLEEIRKTAGLAFHLSTEIPNIEFGMWAIKNN